MQRATHKGEERRCLIPPMRATHQGEERCISLVRGFVMRATNVGEQRMTVWPKELVHPLPGRTASEILAAIAGAKARPAYRQRSTRQIKPSKGKRAMLPEIFELTPNHLSPLQAHLKAPHQFGRAAMAAMFPPNS